MAYDTNISIAAAKAAVDSVVDRLDLGTAANCRVRIYDGSQPASPDVAVGTQTLLAEIDLGTATIFGAAGTSGNSATATASAILPKTQTSATAAGTASWFRAVDADTTAVIDGTVGTSGTDMVIDNTSIAVGQEVKILTWKIKLSKVG
jgi:hypothetical protein